MYWTHLIFALTLGLFVYDDPIIAVKAGYLDFDNLPETNFSCKDKVIGGYYADVETGCQMFHVCTIGQKGEVTDIKFLCLNGTVFDQETRVCERIDEVDCSKSEDFFNLNLELYGNQAGGIQPEEEFFCEDCSTEEDDYADVTTRSPSTSSTTTTTTTRPTTTTTTKRPTTTPTQKVAPHYQTSNPETIAALIALHNAFSQSVQNPKVKPPPPRVINNAFAGVTPSTPRSTFFGRPQVTQLPPRDENQYDDETDHRVHHKFVPPSHRGQEGLRLSHHDQRVRQQDQRVTEQDQRVRQQDQRVTEQDQRVREQDHRIAEQDQRVRQQDLRVPDQDHIILQQDHYTQTHHGNLPPKSTYYQVTTPTNLRANYHHFQSGDAGFVHSFDTGKQYNYHYFQPRKQPEPTAKASVSIVTSTSTSTSMRASRANDTIELTGPEEDFPTGYDDYPDDSVDDAFFRDVPKIRSRRSEPRHANHKYSDEVQDVTTPRHRNHRYDWPTSPPKLSPILEAPRPTVTPKSVPAWPKEPSPWQTPPEIQPSRSAAKILPEEENPTHREAFLQNLLGSLDMDEHDRQKMARFFKVEEKEVDQSAGLLHQLGNKLGELIMDDVNKTIHQAEVRDMKANSSEKQVDLSKLDEMWRNHYEEMSQEVDLKFDLGSERDRSRRDADKKEKLMEELAQDFELVKAKIENVPIPKVDKLENLKIKDTETSRDAKTRIKRQVKGLDTEKFTASHHEPRKRLNSRPLPVAPVTRDALAPNREPPSGREVVPVFEEVDEGDFTTRPYLRLDRTQRPRLTTRSVDSTLRLRFNYEMTTPASPFGPRARANSRSVSGESTLPVYGTLPRLTPPSVTRDVSNLKDTPVYEESDLGDAGPVQGPQGIQIFRPSGHLVPNVSPASEVSSTSEVESTTRAPEVAKRGRRPSGRRVAQGRQSTRLHEDRQPSRIQLDEERPARPRSRENSPSRAHSEDEPSRSDVRPLTRTRSQGQPRIRPQSRQRDRPKQEPVNKPNTEAPVETETDNYPRNFKPLAQPPNPTIAPQTSPDSPEPPPRLLPAFTEPQRPPANLLPANYPQESPVETERIPTNSRGSVRDRDFKVVPHQEPRPERTETRNRGSVRDRDFIAPPIEDAPPSAPKRTPVVSRGKVRGTLRSTTPPNEPPPAPPMDPNLVPDPNYSCEGKVKGGFYADVFNDCKGFFICSQGEINGPLLKSHFWCGTNTKFNQRSRTCQDETLVECSVSSRYYHLNQDFAVPETEEQLRPAFEAHREPQG